MKLRTKLSLIFGAVVAEHIDTLAKQYAFTSGNM